MRRISLALACLMLLAACASTPPTDVEPGTGPAAEVSEPAETTGPTEADSQDPSETTGSFEDQIKYPDGVAVEVTRIKQTKVTASGYAEGLEEGDPYTTLSVRVKNGSGATIDVNLASAQMVYGPDGDEAVSVFDEGIDAMEGKVLPGKSKTGEYGFAVPSKYMSDVQMEFSFDFEHEPAIFTGSIK